MTATPGRLVTLMHRGRRPSCVMLPGAGGGLHPYLRLAGFLGRTHNVYAVRAAGLVPGEEPEESVAAMAGSALEALDEARLQPSLVFGWSLGGVVGWELCVRLAARGVLPDLVLLDSSPLAVRTTAAAEARLLDRITAMLGPRAGDATVERVRRTVTAQVVALAGYRGEASYPGRVLLVRCTGPESEPETSVAAWRARAPDLSERWVDAGHYDVLDAAHHEDLTAALAPFVRRAAVPATTTPQAEPVLRTEPMLESAE
jgi:thioesterase domain-containing protein